MAQWLIEALTGNHRIESSNPLHTHVTLALNNLCCALDLSKAINPNYSVVRKSRKGVVPC